MVSIHTIKIKFVDHREFFVCLFSLLSTCFLLIYEIVDSLPTHLDDLSCKTVIFFDAKTNFARSLILLSSKDLFRPVGLLQE